MPKDFYNDFNTTAIATNQKLKEGRAFQATLLGLINLGLVWASFRTLIDGISFENNYHTYEAIIFIKFYKDWTKIVDFLLMANFLTCSIFFFFFAQTLNYSKVDEFLGKTATVPKA